MRNTANTSEILLTARQTCERMNFSRTTLYELIRAGRIKSVRIGRNGLRIPVRELERFVEEQLAS